MVVVVDCRGREVVDVILARRANVVVVASVVVVLGAVVVVETLVERVGGGAFASFALLQAPALSPRRIRTAADVLRFVVMPH